MAPLGAVIVVFLAFSVPPCLALDPGLSRVPAPGGVPARFQALVVHVVFGSSPWSRRGYPVAYRRAGRVYVFGGCCRRAAALVVG